MSKIYYLSSSDFIVAWTYLASMYMNYPHTNKDYAFKVEPFRSPVVTPLIAERLFDDN